MNFELNNLSLYSSAACDLGCKYCYISKNSKLGSIDKSIAESFENGEFFEFSKEIFTNPRSLTLLELWGGEPSLGFNRVIEVFDDFADYYPNLQTIRISSNFYGYKNAQDFKSLFDKVEEYCVKNNRDFTFGLQVSIDGPADLNDVQRGNGVTEKLLQNYKSVLKTINEGNYKKCKFSFSTKPTLTIETAIDYFKSVNTIQEYYSFFYKEMLKPAEDIGLEMFLGNANFMTPADYTKEDGIKLTNLLLLFEQYISQLRELDPDVYKYFERMNRSPMIFSGMTEQMFAAEYNRNNDLSDLYKVRRGTGGYCGAIIYGATLAPGKRLVTCHRGMLEAFDEYKEEYEKDNKIESRVKLGSKVNKTVYTKEEFFKIREQIVELYTTPNAIRLINLQNLMKLHALSGEIDEKYKNDAEALFAANVMLGTGPCLYVNLATFGSVLVDDDSYAPLLFNGAIDILIKDFERRNVCQKSCKQ